MNIFKLYLITGRIILVIWVTYMYFLLRQWLSFVNIFLNVQSTKAATQYGLFNCHLNDILVMLTALIALIINKMTIFSLQTDLSQFFFGEL